MDKKYKIMLVLGATAILWQGGQIKSYTITDSAAKKSGNLQAFLMAIRSGESGVTDAAYGMMVFGGSFSDFSTHPKVFKTNPRDGTKTSAAGAYQITYTTWVWLHVLAGVNDFSPASQDLMAIAYLRKIGALGDILDGNFSSAARKCKPVWQAFTVPSLLSRMTMTYRNYGGVINA